MKTLSRRSLVAAGSIAGLMGSSARAQAAYPSQTIRLVVPYAPGGGSDFTGRLVAQKLQETAGYTLIVDNRAGAAGMLGTEIVARAPADGYTLLYADVAHGINPAVYSKARYDAVKSFVPITLVGASPQVMVAHPSFPANSLKELLAMPREQLQKIAVGTPGQGSGPHLTYELLRTKAGLDLVHVPYKGGGPALNDAINGQIPLVMNAMAPVMPHLQSGKLKALAIATAELHPRLPEVQTYAESAPGVVVYNWYGFLAPAGTPPEVTNRLAADITRVLLLPDVKEKFDAAFLDPMPQGSIEMARFLDGEVRQWKTVATETGVSLD
jgi:tripartite-type tricarboxylate transporter receptor subunit TctC